MASAAVLAQRGLRGVAHTAVGDDSNTAASATMVRLFGRWQLLPLLLLAVPRLPLHANAQVAGTVSKSTGGLTGLKVFGAGTPYGGNDGRGGYDTVWDGDVKTFFDCEKGCGDTGVEFAVLTAVVAVRFYPRGDCHRCCKDPADTKGACRMVGGSFDGSTVGPTGPWTQLHVITEKPEEEAWTTVNIPATSKQQKFRWFRYTGNAQKSCNVAEIQVFSTEPDSGLGLAVTMLMLGGAGAYLAVGSVLNWRRGKRGLRLLPHLGFWTELRALVVDGVVFSRTRAQPLQAQTLLRSGASEPQGRASERKSGGKHKRQKEKEKKKGKAKAESVDGRSPRPTGVEAAGQQKHDAGGTGRWVHVS